ncbi:MAG TPA: alpha/beta hydrolase [Ktedonobacterales bacterium]|nr:alpha/beta hydrolase [Ktedonobacterales bacterium]
MTTRFLDVPGGRLAYDDQGAGQVVICVPGMGDIRAEYRFLTPQLLDAGYRVVTLDIRGHGESSVRWPEYSAAAVARDVIALARTLDSGPVVIVGTSLAAGTAVCAAADAPELVAGILLISPFARNTQPLWRAGLMSAALAPLFSGPWGSGMWIRYLRTLYPTARPSDFEAYLRRVETNMREPGRLAALRGYLAANQTASGERLGRVNVPALVIMGTKDRDFPSPEAEARQIAASLGRPAEMRMVEGAGHYPHAEAPEVVGPLIVAFLNSMSERVTHGA